MSMDTVINGGSSTAGKANVDANFNLKTTLPAVAGQAGYAVVLAEIDAGTLTGTPIRLSPRVTDDRRLAVGFDTFLFHHMFSATSQSTAAWKYISSTMTAQQAGGFLQLNANSTATTTTGCSMQSWRYFPLIDKCAAMLTISMVINAVPQAGQVLEFGLFVPTATAAPTEGMYLRYTSAGLIGVLNFNGTETTTAVLPGTITVGTVYDYQFIIEEGVVYFSQAGVLLGAAQIGSGNPNIFLNEALPIGIQQRNSGAVSGTQLQAKFSCISVYQQDINTVKPWAHQMAGNGYAYQGSEGGPMGQTTIWANSAAPGAVALSNTAAAFVGLGGIAAINPTLAQGNDGILFSYQNPQGSTTQPARTLVINGVFIQGVVSAALTGGAVALAYAVAFGHTAVSLATAETGSFVTATTKQPRRVPAGFETYPATAAIGVIGGQGIRLKLSSPIVVNPGEFVAIIARNVGTVTTVGAITIIAAFDHYFE